MTASSVKSSNETNSRIRSTSAFCSDFRPLYFLFFAKEARVAEEFLSLCDARVREFRFASLILYVCGLRSW